MNKEKENMEWEMEAPTLASLPRITPYRVPDGYFENLNEQLITQVKIADLMQGNDLGGFTQPAAYFENLEARILAQTTLAAPKKSGRIFKLWQSDVAKYTAAACFVLVSALGLYINNQSNSGSTNNNVAESFSTALNSNRLSEIQDEALLYNIDEQTIIDHLGGFETVSNMQAPVIASDDELEQYLIDHYSSKDLSINY
ncbi:MAG: hypothetical protein EOO99_02255 [Pedobacter sp.]|nr:MAG: hypothetical protein EOO99_02255 [Pedobacter sp.]